MLYFYVKAVHVIFVVTWFAGMFYIVRLCIYHVEANDRNEAERNILSNQYAIMLRRLWYGITWPSAILTLLFGGWLWYLLGITPGWLALKLCFVLGLYLYHLSLDVLVRQQLRRVFKYSSAQLRVWNEVATIFLVAIVMLAVVKHRMSVIWGILGLTAFVIILMSAIRIYHHYREKGDIPKEK